MRGRPEVFIVDDDPGARVWNDQGLVVDSNALHYTRAARHPDKTAYPDSFFVEMLEQCATVEQVKEWAQGYDLLFLETQQTPVADRQGNTVVLGLTECIRAGFKVRRLDKWIFDL